MGRGSRPSSGAHVASKTRAVEGRFFFYRRRRRTPPPPPARRQPTPRGLHEIILVTACLEGKIISADLHCGIDVIIRDMSVGGACVEILPTTQVPKKFDLLVSSEYLFSIPPL